MGLTWPPGAPVGHVAVVAPPRRRRPWARRPPPHGPPPTAPHRPPPTGPLPRGPKGRPSPTADPPLRRRRCQSLRRGGTAPPPRRAAGGAGGGDAPSPPARPRAAATAACAPRPGGGRSATAAVVQCRRHCKHDLAHRGPAACTAAAPARLPPSTAAAVVAASDPLPLRVGAAGAGPAVVCLARSRHRRRRRFHGRWPLAAGTLVFLVPPPAYPNGSVPRRADRGEPVWCPRLLPPSSPARRPMCIVESSGRCRRRRRWPMQGQSRLPPAPRRWLRR